MTLWSFSSRGHFVGGEWRRSGSLFESRSPADLDHVVGVFSDGAEVVDEAVATARRFQPTWAVAPLEARLAVLDAFSSGLQANSEEIAVAIATEMGKPLREARGEAAALSVKIRVTAEIARRELVSVPVPGAGGWYDWRPHGVVAVIGPFNFPVHLSNGHIIPALAAGNVAILKPSETAPGCAELYVRIWEDAARGAGAPPGILSLVQGHGATGAALSAHTGVNVVAFTGSYRVGCAIVSANAHQPGKLIALELGGKNASIVCADADLDRAAMEICAAAFQSAGQRCTATSRVIVHRSNLASLADRVVERARALRIGNPLDVETEIGPLATASSHARFVAAQSERHGLRTLLPGGDHDGPRPGYWVRPAIHEVTDPAASASRWREELFGPELLIEAVDGDDEAVARANATDYGLAAAVFTSSRDRFDSVRSGIRAGLINWNRGTAGASSLLPFGGVGWSGNHRPAGAFSLRYCVYPVATLSG